MLETETLKTVTTVSSELPPSKQDAYQQGKKNPQEEKTKAALGALVHPPGTSKGSM